MKQLSVGILFFLFSFSHLQSEVQVLAFSGSSRKDSLNKKLIKEAVRIAVDMRAKVYFIDLKDYPMQLYDGDFEKEKGVPENAKKLGELIRSSQIIMIASPDYNASVSPLLKNTLDWVSRVKNPFREKTFILLSASPGSGGGARGLVNLRAILEVLGGNVNSEEFSLPRASHAFGNVNSEEFSLPRASHAFDEKGNLKNLERNSLRAFLQSALPVNF